MLWIALCSTGFSMPETCDGQDQDGDGRIDEAPVWFAPDLDDDGHGDMTAALGRVTCAPVQGLVPSVGDCDDTRADVFPGAEERCNGIDDDCNGLVDDGACACPVEVTSRKVWQICDNAEVNFETARQACEDVGFTLPILHDEAEQDELYALVEPYGFNWWLGLDDLAVEGDWRWHDGSRPDLYDNWREGEPNNGFYNDVQNDPEHCGELEPAGTWDDQDCARLKPYLCQRPCRSRTWYADADGDGLGDEATARQACVPEPGEVSNALDCDDSDPSLPGAWFVDGDGDGIGGPEGSVGCVPQGIPVGGDCDDANASIAPDRLEICNGLDDNCSGETDEGDGGPWWPDLDGDGFGDASVEGRSLLCAPDGYVGNGVDCDDANGAISPIAQDVPGDNIDGDCDGSDLPSPDSDGDGLGDALEGAFGTDPLNPDTDADTWLDGQEPLTDTDGDGFIDPMDIDDDGDGRLTLAEDRGDSDGDGAIDPWDPDSDNDGVLDGVDPSPTDPGGRSDPGSAQAPKFGCGCSQSGPGASYGWLGVGLWLVLGRARRARPPR